MLFRHFVIAVFVISAFGCREKEPLPPGLEGHWAQLIPAHPPWEYDFRNGVLTQQIPDIGVLQTYTYAQRADTVLISGDTNNPKRTWIVRFIGDGALEVNQLPAAPTGIGAYMILERK